MSALAGSTFMTKAAALMACLVISIIVLFDSILIVVKMDDRGTF